MAMKLETGYPDWSVEDKRAFWHRLPQNLWCVTVKQPWADMLVGRAVGPDGRPFVRPVENRDWIPEPPIPFPLVIHASKNVDEIAREQFGCEALVTGALLGVVTVIAYHTYDQKSWAEMRPYHREEGPLPIDYRLFAWILRDPFKLKEPVPWRGQPKLYRVPKAALSPKKAAG